MLKSIKNFFVNNKNILIIFFLISILTYAFFGLNNIINIDGIQ